MNEIFISYARSTAKQAQTVADALRSLGYGVWRDDDLPAHRAYAEVIEERLRSAKAVVVIWSAEAAKSQWVRAEADFARNAGTLVQLRVDDTIPPLPFNQIQCADMAGWSGETDSPGWRKVVASVVELVAAGSQAFLMADIDGASVLRLNHRAAMREVDAAFKALVREAATRCGGEFLRGASEMLVAAFARPTDAIVAACEAQAAVLRNSWPEISALKVRMAVDFGPAERRDEQFIGQAVNRCARLLALSHGGQILVTGTIADLIAGQGGPMLKSLGAHPLDDTAKTVHVYQTLVDGLPRDFPPLRLAEVHPNNLPRRQTNLIGRDKDLAQLTALLAEFDLITVTGTGGVGKTRIAIEVGLTELAAHEDGVWLVELAPVSDPAMVPGAVARALNIDLQAGEDPLTCLVDRLSPRHCLIVLDNCEHVIDAAAAFVEAVMKHAPNVKLLVSSQELLGVRGEQVFRLRSLGEPDAVTLFVQRACAAESSFAVTPRNTKAIADICQRLDRIPLAIEMAAARAPALGCEDLLQRLDNRFRILTGGQRTALPRQRTLLATLDWSHSLLSERNAVVFRRLSVFRGGFTLEAASEVAADERIDAFEVIDALSSLVAKSLVVADTEDNRTRFRLLETGRAYALEKLAASGETVAVQRRHAEYVLKFVAHSSAQYNGGMSDYAFTTLYLPESDNIEQAIDWALGADGVPELGVAITVASVWIFMAASRFGEFVQCLAVAETSLTRDTPEPIRCAFLVARATVFMVKNQGMPKGVVDEAIETARAFGDPFLLAEALNAAGFTATFTGRLKEARGLADESLALVAQLPLSRLTGQTHFLAAYVTLVESGEEAAYPLFGQVVTEMRSIGADGVANFYLLAGSSPSIPRNNPDVAIIGLRDTLARIRPWHTDTGMSTGLAASHLAFCLATRGRPADIEEARTVARTFRKVASRGTGGGTVYMYYIAMAWVAAASGRPQSAARIGGYVEAVRAAQGNNLARAREQIERLRSSLGGKLPEAELAAEWADGARLGQEEADRLAVDEG